MLEMLKKAADLGAPWPSVCKAAGGLSAGPLGLLPLMMGLWDFSPASTSCLLWQRKKLSEQIND